MEDSRNSRIQPVAGRRSAATVPSAPTASAPESSAPRRGARARRPRPSSGARSATGHARRRSGRAAAPICTGPFEPAVASGERTRALGRNEPPPPGTRSNASPSQRARYVPRLSSSRAAGGQRVGDHARRRPAKPTDSVALAAREAHAERVVAGGVVAPRRVDGAARRARKKRGVGGRLRAGRGAHAGVDPHAVGRDASAGRRRPEQRRERERRSAASAAAAPTCPRRRARTARAPVAVGAEQPGVRARGVERADLERVELVAGELDGLARPRARAVVVVQRRCPGRAGRARRTARAARRPARTRPRRRARPRSPRRSSPHDWARAAACGVAVTVGVAVAVGGGSRPWGAARRGGAWPSAWPWGSRPDRRGASVPAGTGGASRKRPPGLRTSTLHAAAPRDRRAGRRRRA